MAIIWNIVLFIGILFSSAWVSFFLGNNQPVLIVLASVLVFLLYRKYITSRAIGKNWIFIVFSVLFSTAFIMGKQVNYHLIFDGMDQNYIVIGKKAILATVTLSFLLFPVFTKISDLIKGINLKNDTDKKLLKDPVFFFISWAIILISWLPYLLAFYPGGIVGDGSVTLKEAMVPGFPKTNHWVIFVILVFKFYLWLGSKISADINVAVFLYVLTQYIFFSAVCAFVAYKLRKKQAPLFFSWGTVFMYAVSGFFASYATALWKDAVFSAFIVLLILMLFDLKEDGKITVGYAVKLGLIELFLCFWRNNGLHILLITLVFLLIILRKKALLLMIPSIIVILCTLIIQGPVYNALGVKKDTVIQSFSVPVQQIAAVIGEGKELSAEQKEVLFNIIPEETWKEEYSPALSDDLKNSSNQEYLNAHKKEFLIVWAQLLIPNFPTYVKAYMMQTLGFWQPGVSRGEYYDYWVGIQDIFDDGYVNTDYVNKLTGLHIQDNLKNMMKFIPSGTIVWLMWFSVALIINQRKDVKKRLIVFLPLIACWGIIMLATPIAYAYRYIFMIPLAFPVICFLPFYHAD
jgi:hypothetical protein